MIRDASDFIAPIGYSWWWPATGIALLALIVLWFTAVWLLTRARKPREAAATFAVPTPASLETLRDQYLRRIDALEGEWRAERIDARNAGQRLSTLMREYVDAVSGTATESMTLSDLQLQRFDGLGHAVAGLYPIAFPERSDGDVLASFGAARQVVTTWK